MKRSESEIPYNNGPELKNYRINTKTIEILEKLGIKQFFPIQQHTYDFIYDGKNLMGRDLTGSGKTLAYVLPLVERFRKNKIFEGGINSVGRKPSILVMLPTRELAIQTANVFEQLKYENEYRVLAVYGGAHIESQISAISRGVDIIIGTTGRLIDHLNRNTLPTNNLKCLIMDEADRMLDMGFQEDVEKIYGIITKSSLEKNIQCILFSATFPGWVQNVARKFLNPSYELVDLVKDLTNKTVSSVRHLAMYCPSFDRALLADVILCYAGNNGKTIVFTQTKADANQLYLSEKIKGVEVLHGDIPQSQREITYKGFKEGRFNTLVATDVASRGLDIPNVDLIVQCEPPKDVESYIHRAGRTARAGKSGIVVTFYNKKHAQMMQKIEEIAGINFEKISKPEQKEVEKAANHQIIDILKKIDQNNLSKFDDIANSLIQEFGEKKSILLLLAHVLTNQGKTKEKSLMTQQEGFISFAMETDTEMKNPNFAWSIIKRFLPVIDNSQIKQLFPFNHYCGVIFDVPESAASRLEAAYKEEQNKNHHLGYVIKRLAELPSELNKKNENPHSENKEISSSVIEERQKNLMLVQEEAKIPAGSLWDDCSDPRLNNINSEKDNEKHKMREKSESPEKSHSHSHHSSHHEDIKNDSKLSGISTDIFLWGLKTEDDVKDFLGENRIGWQRIKVLKGIFFKP